jgi:isopenicillin-N epimerase
MVGMGGTGGVDAGGGVGKAATLRAVNPPLPSSPVSPPSHRVLPASSTLAQHWTLDPEIVYLNHGSFGACPRAVLEQQSEFRALMERELVRYFVELLPGLIDRAREAAARFVRCDSQDLVFVANATTGVATVLGNLAGELCIGDELLTTSHEYPACVNNLRHIASMISGKAVVAELPFPIASEEQIVEAVLRAVTPKTRVALVSHVTSQTGLVLPITRLVSELEGRGVMVIVDGAHAPGMVDVDIAGIGASFYTFNCHKWMCAPKGAAMLHVRPDRQKGFRPMVLSNMAEKPIPGRKHMLTEFDYVGTQDVSAWLTVPAALAAMEAMVGVGVEVGGGWDEVRRQNRELVLRGRDLVCRALGIAPPAPDAMLGSMSTIVLPRHAEAVEARLRARPTKYHDALQDELLARYRIQVPVWGLAGKPERFIRISAQLYNTVEQYDYLARALRDALERESGA